MRRQKLIKILESTLNGMPLSAEKLAQMLGVSERTVRYDLEAIGEALEKRGRHLCKKAKKGVWLEAMEPQLPTEMSGYAEYIPNKDERIHAAAVYLLEADQSAATEILAQRLSISRSTLLTDLKDAVHLLRRYGLKLASKKGLGLWIEGREEQKRELLIDIFSKYLYDFGRSVIQSGRLAYEAALFQEYARDLPGKEIAEELIALSGRYRLRCDDVSLNYLVVSLLVQLRRLREGNCIPEEAAAQVQTQQNRMLTALSEEMNVFLQRYQKDFAQSSEQRFTMRRFLSGKIYLPEEEWTAETADAAVNLLSINSARRFIEDCQVWLGDIYLDDEELVYNLALHLQPAVRRAQCGIELANPLLPQIRQQYAGLFSIADRAARNLEEQLHIKISEDEIGYLVIHLGAAIERKKMRKSQRLQVILVCGNGIGTASLLAMTLQNHMNFLDIKKILPAYALQEEALDGIDLVISTIPLHLERTAVLHISPILSEVEIRVIEGQLQHLFHRKFSVQDAPGAPSLCPTLREILTPTNIVLDASAADWEEAVVLAGNLLVKSGAAEPRYVESMVACIRRMGPYIVLGPGIAMPHARPEDGVQRLCLSMVRLKEPVRFGHALHDPIDLVFAFGAVDERSHRGVLYELWQAFQNPAAMRHFRTCQDAAALVPMLAAGKFKDGNGE